MNFITKFYNDCLKKLIKYIIKFCEKSNFALILIKFNN